MERVIEGGKKRLKEKDNKVERMSERERERQRERV